MKTSKVNAINKIAIKGDRNEPVIAAIQNIKINHPELYKELSKVINLWRKTHRLACGMKAPFPTFFLH